MVTPPLWPIPSMNGVVTSPFNHLKADKGTDIYGADNNIVQVAGLLRLSGLRMRYTRTLIALG